MKAFIIIIGSVLFPSIVMKVLSCGTFIIHPFLRAHLWILHPHFLVDCIAVLVMGFYIFHYRRLASAPFSYYFRYVLLSRCAGFGRNRHACHLDSKYFRCDALVCAFTDLVQYLIRGYEIHKNGYSTTSLTAPMEFHRVLFQICCAHEFIIVFFHPCLM